MGNELSLVQSTGSGCLIYRETTGAYVVRHEQVPQQRRMVATLAGAYAACQGWESRLLGQGSDRSGGC